MPFNDDNDEKKIYTELLWNVTGLQGNYINLAKTSESCDLEPINWFCSESKMVS